MKEFVVDDREFELMKRIRNLSEEEFAHFLLKLKEVERQKGRKINNDLLITLLDSQK